MKSSLHTILLIGVFAACYLIYIARETARQRLDLYDFAMLSTVAVIPLSLVVFPQAAVRLAEIAGVGFPFVVMFGLLFAILFIFIHRLTVKIHRLENDSRLVIQELSLLRQAAEKSDPP